jgi:hypothetical protein
MTLFQRVRKAFISDWMDKLKFWVLKVGWDSFGGRV